MTPFAAWSQRIEEGRRAMALRAARIDGALALAAQNARDNGGAGTVEALERAAAEANKLAGYLTAERDKAKIEAP